MAMYVFGAEPTNKEGRVFGRSVWNWRPLADLCITLAPDIACGCPEWQGNEGYGLDARGARLLAEKLQSLLRDGTIKGYIERHNEMLAALPREVCFRCDGMGTVRTSGNIVICQNCGGARTQRSCETFCTLDEQDVKEWIAFLRACGGFSIC